MYPAAGYSVSKASFWIRIRSGSNSTRQKDQIRFAPIGAGQDVVIVIGQDLVEENIDKYLS